MEREYDLFLFAGQSNMAGRGITSQQWRETAPEGIPGAGYEYRAVSDPERLSVVKEPFGVNENDPKGIYEPGMKTGSMVTAFINAYYLKTGMPVLAVSASKGGSSIEQWQGTEDYLTDAIRRFRKAEGYVEEKQLLIRHRYVAWCQGETDGDLGTDPAIYKERFENMFDQLKKEGIETCFLIAIGEYNGDKGFDYSKIRQAQIELAKEIPEIELVCDDFHTMRARGLMKDDFHYYQKAYNEAGRTAGNKAGAFVNQLK